MFSALFNRKPPLDEMSARWILDTYHWAFRNFPVNIFFEQTRLVLPDDHFFPADVKSMQGRAELIFDRVAEYAGLSHWSWQVVDSTHCHVSREVILPERAGQGFSGVRRLSMDKPLPVVYEARLVGNREALVAGFAQALAQYLIRTGRELPPGGAVRWSQAVDLLTIFMGFGVVYTNSFPLFLPMSQGGSRREQDHLSQWDAAYALAIFCVLKRIPKREVLVHLKRPVRSFFNRAMSDVVMRRDQLPDIQELPERSSMKHSA